MEMDWVTGGYGDNRVADMNGETGGIYLGDARVDSLHHILYIVSYHLISSHYTTNYTLQLSHLLISLDLSDILLIQAPAWIFTAG